MLETEEATMLGDPVMGAIADTSLRGEHIVVAVTSHHEDHLVAAAVLAGRDLMQHRMAVVTAADIPAATAGETMGDIVS